MWRQASPVGVHHAVGQGCCDGQAMAHACQIQCLLLESFRVPARHMAPSPSFLYLVIRPP